MLVLTKILLASVLMAITAPQGDAMDPGRLKLLSGSLAVTMTCDTAPSSDPQIVLSITNVGSTVSVIPNEGVEAVVDLTVKNGSGTVIHRRAGVSGGEFSTADRLLQPGQQMPLVYYMGPSKPTISKFPLSLWRYFALSPGAYHITAAAAEPAKTAAVGQCDVTIK